VAPAWRQAGQKHNTDRVIRQILGDALRPLVLVNGADHKRIVAIRLGAGQGHLSPGLSDAGSRQRPRRPSLLRTLRLLHGNLIDVC